MSEHIYTPRGVCSRQIEFDLEEGRIHNVRFTGGCDGNLKAIAKLVEGKQACEIIDLLEGNTCGPRTTSCADQLVRALKAASA
ncbi:TIGR03905 family TSCPD domain-containing protein [Adlercreutzia murintestinalis]|uniref:TIGR03905 family TSCPD domain-containing protein n=1 Tax=Adlercreutzia murintestinalis TaxID=2941325 RepID=UPI0020407F58|nr:TIGR03905 family TSCPD domain-containing protein [Adlercreutzia murintestinalis]